MFRNASDPFDPERHYFHASITEGVMLKKKMREATGVRITSAAPKPGIIEYFDHARGTSDRFVTPSAIGQITGEDLKFDPGNAAEGIFFINKEDDSETKVEMISVRTEGKLMFLVPAEITAGSYTLEVRRAYNSSVNVRTGTLDKTLTVS